MNNHGFGNKGVEGNSDASKWQSAQGNVEKGSAFSGLQSTGASGGNTALGEAGFGSGGVARGSAAAEMQASIGDVKKGSTFATSQSQQAKKN